MRASNSFSNPGVQFCIPTSQLSTSSPIRPRLVSGARIGSSGCIIRSKWKATASARYLSHSRPIPVSGAERFSVPRGVKPKRRTVQRPGGRLPAQDAVGLDVPADVDHPVGRNDVRAGVGDRAQPPSVVLGVAALPPVLEARDAAASRTWE